MTSRYEEMLGKVVERLVRLIHRHNADFLRVIFDVLEKLYGDGTHDQWVTELKRFARKESCWVPYFIRTELERYLLVARVVLLGHGDWTESKLIEEMHLYEPSFSTWDAHHYLQLLDSLQVTENLGNCQHKVLMVPQEFEETFGTKLPRREV